MRGLVADDFAQQIFATAWREAVTEMKARGFVVRDAETAGHPAAENDPDPRREAGVGEAPGRQAAAELTVGDGVSFGQALSAGLSDARREATIGRGQPESRKIHGARPRESRVLEGPRLPAGLHLHEPDDIGRTRVAGSLQRRSNAGDLEAQLLGQLPGRGILDRLAAPLLSARKLPQSGVALPGGATA